MVITVVFIIVVLLVFVGMFPSLIDRCARAFEHKVRFGRGVVRHEDLKDEPYLMPGSNAKNKGVRPPGEPHG